MAKCKTVKGFSEKLNNATHKINLALGLGKEILEDLERRKTAIIELTEFLQQEETITKINSNVCRLSFVNNSFNLEETTSILDVLNDKIPTIPLFIFMGNTPSICIGMDKYKKFNLPEIKTLSPEQVEDNQIKYKDTFLNVGKISIERRKSASATISQHDAKETTKKEVVGKFTQNLEPIEGSPAAIFKHSHSFSGSTLSNKR
jgi:hypothetical protein